MPPRHIMPKNGRVPMLALYRGSTVYNYIYILYLLLYILYLLLYIYIYSIFYLNFLYRNCLLPSVTNLSHLKTLVGSVFCRPIFILSLIYTKVFCQPTKQMMQMTLCETTGRLRTITLKGLAHAKIIKKSVILFRVLNMTI